MGQKSGEKGSGSGLVSGLSSYSGGLDKCLIALRGGEGGEDEIAIVL